MQLSSKSIIDQHQDLNLKVWLSDREVFITQLRNHDKKAFAHLYKQYSAALYGSLLQKLNNEEIAQKLLEQTFIEAWNRIAQFDETKLKLFTWLNQISLRLIKALHS